MPGCDQGSTSLAWMTPPLPQLVSSAADGLPLDDLDVVPGLAKIPGGGDADRTGAEHDGRPGSHQRVRRGQ